MHNHRHFSFVGVATLALAMTGCTLTPDYERPAAPVANAWPTSTATATGHAPSEQPGWRDFFADPRLQQLIHLGLENNRDLRVAVLNVEQSRAQYRIQRADLLPSISATGSAARQRTPADLSGTGQAVTGSQYSVSVGATAYELDLFGRVRSLRNAALETYLGTEDARRSAQISLVAEIALQYLTERSYQEQLALAEQTLEITQSSYEVARTKYEHGTTSELDLRTAEASLQSAKSTVAVYQRQRAQAENALVFLIGQPLPADLPPSRALAEQTLVALQAGNIPSMVLSQRPDVLGAEHALKAANANIGAARAAFFPSISLTGSFGTSSSELSQLFTPGAKTWSFTPQINLPIFAAGRNRANLDVSNVSKRIEVARYERAIQTAFREVADALIAQAPLDRQFEADRARVDAETKRYQLSDLRYQRGTDSYLTLLLARQDLYSAQQSLIQTQLSRLANYISLYQALGGGVTDASSTSTAVTREDQPRTKEKTPTVASSEKPRASKS